MFITGDYQNNYVAVGNAGPNSFRIGTREGTLINGSNDTEQTFTGVTNDINIVMKGGNDQVFIGSESSHARIPRNLNVDCADDSVYLYAFCGASGR